MRMGYNCDKETDMEDPKAIFREYCGSHGMRYTREREMIIDEIYRKDGHFDIDSLFLRIRNRHPNIKLAKGSIYRALPHFIRTGLIRKSFTDEGHACYEHTLGHSHHDHMKCIGCGRIFEFYEKQIDRIQQKLCKKRGFTMLWHTHIISGYCAKCRKKKE